MAADSEILTETRDGVTTITLNRPDALNALTPDMLVGLGDAIETAGDDEAVRAIVITGAGRAFSAGVDLKVLGDRPIVNGSVGDILDVPARRAIRLMEIAPKPVIARVNGHCYTGALELVLGCDLSYAAAEARFGDTHARWGVRPSWGMSQRLPRRVGVLRAREMSLTARNVSASEAVEWGLVNGCAPAEELDGLLVSVLEQILANSPWVMAAYKVLYRDTEDRSLTAGLAFEAGVTFEIADTQERLAGFRK
ncbi:MAG: enoyl-CoA hydratase-related protein [Gammaproteobacteria bacterium]